MTRSSLRAAIGSRPAVLLLAGVLFSGAAGLSSSDALLERGYSAVLPQTLTAVRASVAPVAGSEDFWLAGAEGRPGLETVAWTAPVAAGDRIRIRTGNGEQSLEVLAVAEKEPETTRIDTGKGGPTYIVTCRDAAGTMTSIELGRDGSLIARDPTAPSGDRIL